MKQGRTTEMSYYSIGGVGKEWDVVVRRADKGNKVVILNRYDYITKLNDLLAHAEHTNSVEKTLLSPDNKSKTKP